MIRIPAQQRRALGSLAFLVLFSLACGVCGFGRGSSTPTVPPTSVVTQPENSQVQIGRVVTARAVGQNNQPTDVTSTFSTTGPIIYVVAEIQRIPPGTAVFARWFRNGEPIEDTGTITADREYTNTYLEFHIQPKTEGALSAGQYAVTLFVNGNPYQTVEFTVQ